MVPFPLLSLAKLLPSVAMKFVPDMSKHWRTVRRRFWRFVARRVVKAIVADAIDTRLELYEMIDFRIDGRINALVAALQSKPRQQ